MPENNDTKTSLMVELNDKLEKLVDCLIPVRTLLVVISSIFTVILSFVLAFYFRHDFSFHTQEAAFLPRILLLAVVVKLAVFLVFKLYGGMWRYVSIIDLLKMLCANTLASGVLLLLVYFFRNKYFPGFSLNVLVIDYLLCFLIMSGKRVIVRIIRESAAKASGVQSIRTIIVGEAGKVNALIQAFSAAPSSRKLIGVLCDEIKTGQTIRGVPVFGKPLSAAKCAKKHRASEILLLPPYSTPKNIREIMDGLEEREAACNLRMIPAYSDIADGNINVSHIREVEIEDLLGRKPVKLDRTEVAQFVKGKNIMVTGAGGSIGSELCNQIVSYGPEKLVLFELSEYNLYEINRKLKAQHPDAKLVNFIGDVRSEEDVAKALSENNIDVVYHAAAYKHVPLMEENPSMAFKTNVLGTACLAENCEKYKVKRIVMISSDKAVRPTSVMGASKRLAERVILERASHETEFVVVRFGNVLDSSGSVIPLFKQQIKAGGPVTVTSEKMIRYFMSIPEAVDLVLQAGTIGNDRDIMVLEMGEQVRIYDMAKKLIELSGFIPGRDIEIKIIGMRPGEKEYEELLTDEEKVDRTPFDRIFVLRKEDTKVPSVDLDRIRELVKANDPVKLKDLFHEWIPENKFAEAAK
jgi:FlaA1/EpsC-like NDP-sugar epimerase